MNARKARALRRMARRMTPGLPAGELVADGNGVSGYRNVNGQAVPFFLPGTLRHKATTTRAVYQKLKRVYGRSNLGALK
ncbi:hypothetical protein CAL26_09880 [Bordetella genomosp. 9]|uniref:Uncharacterized protein n=1 Tax=Bordetella genomosp. 9 TaxID=1416803 RepID=A0A261RGH5_9BORD|nr:hypothetical protein [Bordetella genomosp. 9]OZI23730.1 hypothetical protein CAL26_09880 [Bordetella genomosp. 9]